MLDNSQYITCGVSTLIVSAVSMCVVCASGTRSFPLRIVWPSRKWLVIDHTWIGRGEGERGGREGGRGKWYKEWNYYLRLLLLSLDPRLPKMLGSRL